MTRDEHPHHGGVHRFEHAGEWARKLDDPERGSRQETDRILASLALDKTMTVADIGAGTGYFTMRLAPLVAAVIATDVEPDMVSYIRARAAREGHENIRSVATPPDDPQLAAGSCDRILIVDVWHHLSDRPAYAAKLAAALRPGGFVAIVDSKPGATGDPHAHHLLAAAVVIADLEAGGLEAKVALDLAEQHVIHARSIAGA